MNYTSYRNLDVWQKAMDLVIECYQITKDFPKSEIYGLSSQLRRAAVSIPAISLKDENVNIPRSLFNTFR